MSTPINSQLAQEKKREYARQWRFANSKKLKEYNRKWRLANPEKVKEASQKQYHANPKKARESALKRRHANLEKMRKQSREWRYANLEKAREQSRQWHLAHPEIVKEQNRRWCLANSEKLKEYARKWRFANPEKAREAEKQGSQRRRARKANAVFNDFTAAQWQLLKTHFKHRCVYCLKKSKRLTMDHITPLSKGGSHTMANILPACQPCNSQKHTGSVPVPVQPLLL